MINWYQTIPALGIIGRIDTPKEFVKIGLPADLKDKSVLDIGCNIGAFLIECWERGATDLAGVETNNEWRYLAWGITKEALYNEEVEFDFRPSVDDFGLQYDLVLLLSVTHVVEGMTGQEILNKAYEHVKPGGLLILEINDRLQKEKLTLPKGAKLYGTAKDNRSVYHCLKM